MIIAIIVAYFLIGILTFCWGIRNILLNSGRPKLYDNNPSVWFNWLDNDDIFFCSVLGVFWPIVLPIIFLIITIANMARWLWKHLLVKIITKSIEYKLRKEKKTDK